MGRSGTSRTLAAMSDSRLAAGAVALRRIGGLLLAAALAGVLVAGLVLPMAGLTGFTARQVSDGIQNLPSAIEKGTIPHTTKVYAANGKLLARFYDENREEVAISDVAPIMRKSIVAIEDSRFYEHGAIDVEGTTRALVNNIIGNDIQGGSTITQQLIKLILIEQADTKRAIAAATEQSYGRKLRELQYAMAYEEQHSKNEILEDYLNIAFFGDGAYGIHSAARHYFKVSPAKLNLAQASMLAGLVQNPSRFNPTENPDLALERRNVVLQRMADLGIITERAAKQTTKQPLGLRVKDFDNGCVSTAAPFFCDFVRRYLLKDPALGANREEREHRLETGGLTIRTTIDLRFQRAADRAVGDNVYPKDPAIGGMAMVEPGTGEVKALAQSRPMGNNADKGQTYLNYVVPKEYGDSNGFQGGSTFKIFTLASALAQGLPLSTGFISPPSYYVPAGTTTDCAGNPTGSWQVSNSTDSGYMNMYTGTQNSVNTFFAQLETKTGVCPPVTLARKQGVKVYKRQEVPSFTLGVTDINPVTMASVYATAAARGMYCQPHPVTEVIDRDGNELDLSTPDCTRVYSEAVADAVNDILRGVIEGGFASAYALDQPAAGKTGTTQDTKAVWFAGYTPNLATAAMIAGANDFGQPQQVYDRVIGGQYIDFSTASGTGFAAPMWSEAMEVVQRWLPDVDFSPVNPEALGSAGVTIPGDLGGLSVDEASARLSDLGLVPVVGATVDSSYPEGTVAGTSPPAGATTFEGEQVILSISDGSPYQPPQPPEPTHSPPNGPVVPVVPAVVRAVARATSSRLGASATRVRPGLRRRAGAVPPRRRPRRRHDRSPAVAGRP